MGSCTGGWGPKSRQLLQIICSRAKNWTEDHEKRYAKSFDRISNLRFFIFLAGAALTVLCSFLGTSIQAVSVFFFFLVVFLALVHKHSKVEQELNTVRAMLEIQRRYLSRMNGTWVSFADCGLEFVDGNHPYTYDLDIFGPKSLALPSSSAINSIH